MEERKDNCADEPKGPCCLIGIRLFHQPQRAVEAAFLCAVFDQGGVCYARTKRRTARVPVIEVGFAMNLVAALLGYRVDHGTHGATVLRGIGTGVHLKLAHRSL